MASAHLSRRQFLTAAGLAAASARLSAAPAGITAQARVRRVFAAGPPAAVLTYMLAPDVLIGWPSRLAPDAAAMLGTPGADLPVAGRLADSPGCEDFDDCAKRVAWSLGELSDRERAGLRALYDRRQGRMGETPMRWALVAWDVG